MYENSASLADLDLNVYLNNQLKFKDVDYSVGTSPNNLTTVTFLQPAYTSTTGLTVGDTVILKTNSTATDEIIELVKEFKFKVAIEIIKGDLTIA